MKLPATPPNPADIIGKLGTGSKGIERLLQIAMAQFGPAPDHQYRHWDTLRHVEPPEGFTVEEWWLGIRMARQSLSRTLPIRDGNGQPFSFTMTHRLCKFCGLIFFILKCVDEPIIGEN